MSFNPNGAAPLYLTVFSGLVTEMPPENAPEGVSPDCQECVFRPGAVGKRPGLTKVFTNAFGATTITYCKSYVDNQSTIRNLYLDANGNLWVEDLTNAPGAYTLLSMVTPGSYAKSVTAFGREYIAISDGLHGSDIPLQYDGTFLDRVSQDGPGGAPTITNLLIPAVAMALGGFGFSVYRQNNIVTVATATPHGLLVGYLAGITGLSAQPCGFITTITINNQDNPGFATVVTASPHGLGSGQSVSLIYVDPAPVGTGIASISRQGEVCTLETTAPHGLAEGAVVNVAGVADASFNSTATVLAVIDLLTFTYAQVDVDAFVGGGGTVTLNWPTGQGTDTLFEVVDVPTDSSFTVEISYVNGVWGGGSSSVTKPWDGNFFVLSVIDPNTFTYKDNGPDGNTTDIGTVTPTGQAAPGQRQMVVLYETRQGYVTAPSPPILLTVNGGQYLQVSNIPIGPPNVVARILAFTGANGSNYFYIPVAAQINGQIVSTSTRIDDNTTTSVVLDFSDNTLYRALGITTIGNNLPAQIVLDGALAFGFYASRLITCGQRNRVNEFLNMGFDGGAFPATPDIPTGWTPVGGGGALAPGRFGQGWNITASGALTQSAYQTAAGDPIILPNTKYRFRAWLQGAAATLTAVISSASTGFTSTVTLTGTSILGSYFEAAFDTQMPSAIPADMILQISGTTVLVDEMSVIYADSPYLADMLGSYINNPEAFDGVTGTFGPEDDTHPVLAFAIVRSVLYLLTQDPAGRLHSAPNNGVTEPSGWEIDEVGSNCGAISAFCVTVSQADDESGSGGEEWMAWVCSGSVRIFGGNQPWKISQEIQPDFDAINPAANLTIWALNDPVTRRIYFGLPLGAATAPNLIYPVDYRELDTAEQIAQSSPIHTSYSGRLIATDHVRKWTRWNLTMNTAALMFRQPGVLTPVFAVGNGAFPGAVGGGCGNLYILCVNKLFDDCFGFIPWYYITYAFANHDQEQQNQIGWGRHTLQYFAYEVVGQAGLNNGYVKVTALVNQITNPWPLFTQRNVRVNPTYDYEWPGGNAQGQRIFFKFESLPGVVPGN